jgi:hypothetical protein
MQDSRIKYKKFLPPASLLYERLRPKRSYAAGFTAALKLVIPQLLQNQTYLGFIVPT